MTFWEFFGALASSASIVSLALALSSLYNGRATRRLIREMGGETQTRLDRAQELIAQGDTHTQDLIARLHTETLAVLERIDQRADERHREVIEAIRALRA